MKNRCNFSLSLGFTALCFFNLGWAQVLPFTANEGITGSWYDVATDGQGFIIELSPTQANTLIVYWFTYDPTQSTTDPFWLTGTGTLNDNSADINFNLVTGGTFDMGGGTSSDPMWASGTITFNSCTSAGLTYNLPAVARTTSAGNGPKLEKAGSIELTRLSPDNTCETGGVLPKDEDWAGTFEGFWHNQTFGSTGSAKVVVTYDPITGDYDVSEDYGGNVFGVSDPDPVLSTVTEVDFGKDESIIDDDPVYGDCTTEYTDAGRFRGSCTPPAFDLVNYEGSESPSHMKWTYEIIDGGMVFAVGTVVVWRTE